VYLKISEPISLTGSADGRAKTKPPFRPPRLETEAKSLPRSERRAFYYWGTISSFSNPALRDCSALPSLAANYSKN